MKRRMPYLVPWAVLLVLLAVRTLYWVVRGVPPPPVTAQPLFRGVTYTRDVRTAPRPLVIHLITVDLLAPGIRFLVTPPDNPGSDRPLRARTTSEFLQKSGAQVAINGDFFAPYHSRDGEPSAAQGYASSDGLPCGTSGTEYPTLCISQDNRATIRRVEATDPTPYNAISGDRLLVDGGQVTATAKAGGRTDPRSAAGLDRSGRHLLLMVVDGRLPGYSEGMTLAEVAACLRDVGAWTALNFDGGGSATLAVEGADGQPEVKSRPVDDLLPGAERPVANHLALFAAPLGQDTPRADR